MKIKSTLLLVSGVLTLLLTLGCTSSSDQKFGDPNNADEGSASVQFLVTGIEAGVRLELGIYTRAISTFARDTYYFEPSDPRYTGELLFGPIDPGGFLLTRPWSARYRVIKDCNILLERAAEQGGSFGSGTSGWARTMEAYLHLLNLNYLDSNGIRVDVAGETPGPFVSKADALAYIANTLDTGYGNLTGGGGSFSFQLSAGFAGFDTPATCAQFNRALRARVAAYQEDWAGVDAALADSFFDLNGSYDTGVYHVWSGSSGDLLNPIFEDPGASSVKFHAHPSFEAEAEAGDPRFSGKVVKVADVRTYDGLNSDLRVNSFKSDTDPYPIIRNEELILLSAEADIHQGNYGAAEATINSLRSHYGLPNASITGEADGLAQLMHERRYSLFTEGHRWVDLRRYGMLGGLPIDRPGDVVIEKMPIPTDELQVGQ
jgi:hypothetical protein